MWVRAKRLPTALTLALLLASALLLSAWHVAAPDVPPGCDAVYAATTRGGADAPRSRGGWACTALRRTATEGVLVERVVDGDTIVVQGGQRVRYVGMDTPEVSGRPEPYGREASDFNRRLVYGARVRLERDVSETDRYDRLLRYVYAGDILVNAELVREGYAQAMEYPPDTRYASCFDALEREARESHRGMWGSR